MASGGNLWTANANAVPPPIRPHVLVGFPGLANRKFPSFPRSMASLLARREGPTVLCSGLLLG